LARRIAAANTGAATCAAAGGGRLTELRNAMCPMGLADASGKRGH
jgi:hypothetical protein